jgi:hypothetical protein
MQPGVIELLGYNRKVDFLDKLPARAHTSGKPHP